MSINTELMGIGQYVILRLSQRGFKPVGAYRDGTRAEVVTADFKLVQAVWGGHERIGYFIDNDGNRVTAILAKVKK